MVDCAPEIKRRIDSKLNKGVPCKEEENCGFYIKLDSEVNNSLQRKDHYLQCITFSANCVNNLF